METIQVLLECRQCKKCADVWDGDDMEKQERKISKTERILSIYHLLVRCEEVSMREIAQYLPGCKKTFSRDIALLKKCGFPIRYSAKRRAFVMERNKKTTSAKAAGKKEEIFLGKLRRLTRIIDEIPDEDCGRWYEETFPQISKRTMLRDFATMNAIGYSIMYERDLYGRYILDDDRPPWRYYCDRPDGTYTLRTFRDVFIDDFDY